MINGIVLGCSEYDIVKSISAKKLYQPSFLLIINNKILKIIAIYKKNLGKEIKRNACNEYL